MWIMVAGPYSAGAIDPASRGANLDALNLAALALLERGHMPVIGVNMARPVIRSFASPLAAAHTTVAGETRHAEIMLPLSLALAERCDAILRLGGPSTDADREMERFRERGLPVYRSLDEIPPASSPA